MRIRCVGQTDVGRRRERNEDAFLIDESLGLFVVADGMGGHAGGDIASRLAVETVGSVLREAAADPSGPFAAEAPLPESPLPDLLRSAVEKGCAAIFRRAQEEPELSGMGTTVTALLLREADAFFAHVGDSRAYLVRADLIQQISEDHSFVHEQVKAGVITAEEARYSRFKNIITRSVGFEEQVLVDLMGLVAEPGDVFVLCSDGLANLVEDHEIHDLAREKPLEDLPAALVDLANERGGDDNITVVAVRLES
ncbi:Stp1/IreP family PP2C-type Ser/Thr phosphatase [Vulgatibacter sp.]|uniref:Stp1/IreP family PP2C-type Ser/Thr phosphatase n=1 Tax=Vulgatibacter sp. TaxID=1971226 RepID=UPI00356AC07F